jgi:hypothetical protein
MKRLCCSYGLYVALIVLLAPALAHAQYGAIAGSVKDATGAVLPGATVEASSAALIEKVRSVVTDESGQYRIVDLRPGTYVVTFTLPGFSTVKREGITLDVGFTASVNAELKVGGVEETIVVSGVNPIVDVQNVRTQQVVTREIIDVLPTGKAFQNLGKLVPAVAGDTDVGGTSAGVGWRLTSYGGRADDQVLLVEGMAVGAPQFGAGSTTLSTLSDAIVEQTIFEAAGHSAEVESGGVVVNLIPKAGGNTFSGSGFGNYTTTALQANNLTDDLRAQGLTRTNNVDFTSDVSGSLGGRLVTDRLWFFGALRDLRRSTYVFDRYPNLLPTEGWRYQADLTTQPTDRTVTQDSTGRLTWQVTDKHKLAGFHSFTRRRDPTYVPAPPVSLEASWNQNIFTRITQGTWTFPATNRLLFDAGLSLANLHFVVKPQANSVGPAAIDIGTNTLLHSLSAGPVATNLLVYRDLQSYNNVVRASMSYVTGTHSLKVGGVFSPGEADFHLHSLSDYDVRLLNGVPNAVVYLPTPIQILDQFRKTALFAQDQWTIRRLTLNLGARIDWMNSNYPAVDQVATRWLPARSYPGADVLGWLDWSPRLGLSYDVSGNGKTAVKFSVSRYMLQQTTAFNRFVNPSISFGTLTRTWTDANGDFTPQGNPLVAAANGEIGPTPNANWGTPAVNLSYDPEWSQGNGVRPSQWEITAGLQHELTTGLSANFMYLRRSYANFAATDNRAVEASDFSPYCITTPVDARLPDGGGKPLCGLYDISPAKLGQVSFLGGAASTYGKQTDVWQGIDAGLNLRLPGGALLQGGVNIGKTVNDNCEIVNKYFGKVTAANVLGSVQSTEMCHVETPFLVQAKMFGSYMLPFSVQLSGTFQSVTGSALSANYVATNAVISPSLRRNLSSGANGTATINIVTPGTLYNDRQNQLDLRFARTFAVGRTRLKGMFDIYNATNGSPVLTRNTTYGTNGAAWLRPLAILPGRLFKVGAQVDF